MADEFGNVQHMREKVIGIDFLCLRMEALKHFCFQKIIVFYYVLDIVTNLNVIKGMHSFLTINLNTF